MVKSLQSVCITEIPTNVCACCGKEEKGSEYNSYSWRWKSHLSHSPLWLSLKKILRISLWSNYHSQWLSGLHYPKTYIYQGWNNSFCMIQMQLLIFKTITSNRTRTSLVILEALWKREEQPEHLFSGVLLLVMKIRCLKWEQKCNHMERCCHMQTTILIKLMGCKR